MKSEDGVKDVARYVKITDGMIIFISWESVPEVFKFNRSQLRSRSPKIFLIPIDIMIQDGECIGANFEAYAPDKRQNTDDTDWEWVMGTFHP